jgi:uncharacterized protein YicC (UPF0701 family)
MDLIKQTMLNQRDCTKLQSLFLSHIMINTCSDTQVSLKHAYGKYIARGKFQITIQLVDENQNVKSFQKVTTNVDFVDSLWDIAENNQLFVEALYQHVKKDIQSKVIDWLCQENK